MKLKLPSSIHSPQDLDRLIIDVHTYAHWYSQNSVKKQTGVKAVDPPELPENTMDMVDTWQGQKDVSNESLERLIESLKDFKDTAPVIHVTLAAPAGSQHRELITGWCRDNLSPYVLVEFGFDSSLLGGMVVRFGSHIYDWSFRRQLLDNRSSFSEVLRHV